MARTLCSPSLHRQRLSRRSIALTWDVFKETSAYLGGFDSKKVPHLLLWVFFLNDKRGLQPELLIIRGSLFNGASYR